MVCIFFMVIFMELYKRLNDLEVFWILLIFFSFIGLRRMGLRREEVEVRLFRVK